MDMTERELLVQIDSNVGHMKESFGKFERQTNKRLDDHDSKLSEHGRNFGKVNLDLQKIDNKTTKGNWVRNIIGIILSMMAIIAAWAAVAKAQPGPPVEWERNVDTVINIEGVVHKFHNSAGDTLISGKVGASWYITSTTAAGGSLVDSAKWVRNSVDTSAALTQYGVVFASGVNRLVSTGVWTNGYFLVGRGAGNYPLLTAMSGDGTLDAAGALTIGADKIDSANIVAGSIYEENLDFSNSPTDNYLLSYNLAGTNFTWVLSPAGGVWEEIDGAVDSAFWVAANLDTALVITSDGSGNTKVGPGLQSSGAGSTLRLSPDTIDAFVQVGDIDLDDEVTHSPLVFWRDVDNQYFSIQKYDDGTARLYNSETAINFYSNNDANDPITFSTAAGVSTIQTLESGDNGDLNIIAGGNDIGFDDNTLTIKAFIWYTGGDAGGTYDSTDAPTDGQQLTWNTGGTIDWQAAGAGGGEANTLGDTGTFNGTEGFGLAGGKTGTVLKVKGLIEGANITIATSGDSAVTITGSDTSTVLSEAAGGSDKVWWSGDTLHILQSGNADTLHFSYDGTNWVIGGEGMTIIDSAQIGNLYVDTIFLDGDTLSEDKLPAYSVRMKVRNDGTGATLPAGTPVYMTGTITGNAMHVDSAKASSATLMPAVGILMDDIADPANGYAVISGRIMGLNTGGFTINDCLYVGSDGGLTATRPSWPDSVQKVGIVTKVDGANGFVDVMGAGRMNDIPNLPDSHFFLGNGSGDPVGVDMTGGVTMSNAGVTTVQAVPADVVLLNEIGDPTANSIISMGAYDVRWTFANPSTDGFNIEATGVFTGDLLHVHQVSGNPGAVHLVHIEAADPDVLPLWVNHTGVRDSIAVFIGGAVFMDSLDVAGAVRTGALDVTGNITVSGTVDGVNVAAHSTRHEGAGADNITVTSLMVANGTLEPVDLNQSSKFNYNGGLYLVDTTEADSACITIETLEDTAALRGLKAGETWTGVHDAGGATSLEIPNGTNPTVDAVGEVAQDSDDNAIRAYDGTRPVHVPIKFTHELMIWNPDLITDTIPMTELDSATQQGGVVIENLSVLTSEDGTYELKFFSFTSADPPVFHDYVDTLNVGASDQFVSSATFEDVNAQTLDVGQRLYYLTPATDIAWIKIKVRYYNKDND